MSGIFGIVCLTGKQDTSGQLNRMADSLKHRGPDGFSVWNDGYAGLGHGMLCASPEAHLEKLPYHDVDRGLTITADARLDNRQELIEKFGRSSFKMELLPDSQILLQAFLRWGKGCVDYLRGDFAFVIWVQNERRLIVFRDHLGVKPFCYYHQDDLFIFSSEAESISSCQKVSINEARIADSLTPHLEGIDKTSTCYREIFRLPPAHCLEINESGLNITRYWQPQPQPVLRLGSDFEYQEAFSEILQRSISARCRGIHNPGLLLSGGVDSATVLAFLVKSGAPTITGSLHCFSGIAAKPEQCKETQMLNRLSSLGGFEHHSYTAKSMLEPGGAVYSLLQKLQEPFDVYMVLILGLYQKAALKGCRVVLDGVDGDMLCSLSSNYPTHLLQQGLLRTAWRETVSQVTGPYRGYRNPISLYSRYLLSAWLPEPFKRTLWSIIRRVRIRRYLANSVIDLDFAREIDLAQRLTRYEIEYRTAALQFPSENYLTHVLHPFLVVGLERYDRVASLCSIEARHPLVSMEIVDYFARLPWQQFCRNGWSKFLLRQVASRYLPQEICWRCGNEHLGGDFLNSYLRCRQQEAGRESQIVKEKVKKYIRKDPALHNYTQNGYLKASSPDFTTPEITGLTQWLEKNKEKL